MEFRQVCGAWNCKFLITRMFAFRTKKCLESHVITKIHLNGPAYVQEEQESTFHLWRGRDFHLVIQH